VEGGGRKGREKEEREGRERKGVGPAYFSDDSSAHGALEVCSR